MRLSHICMTICIDSYIFVREYIGQYMYKGNAGVCMHENRCGFVYVCVGI